MFNIFGDESPLLWPIYFLALLLLSLLTHQLPYFSLPYLHRKGLNNNDGDYNCFIRMYIIPLRNFFGLLISPIFALAPKLDLLKCGLSSHLLIAFSG